MSADAIRPIEVLLVEDDEADVRLTRECLEAGEVLNRLTVLGDGAKVVRYLRGDHAGAPRPDLVLLDLNLPGRHGREVLADIKGDPELRRIPVVELTASKAEEDVVRSYDLHANAYVTKPVDLDCFVEVIRKCERKGAWPDRKRPWTRRVVDDGGLMQSVPGVIPTPGTLMPRTERALRQIHDRSGKRHRKNHPAQTLA